MLWFHNIYREIIKILSASDVRIWFKLKDHTEEDKSEKKNRLYIYFWPRVTGESQLVNVWCNNRGSSQNVLQSIRNASAVEARLPLRMRRWRRL
jgi:hypothetical protein